MSEWIDVDDKMPGNDRMLLLWGPMLGFVIGQYEGGWTDAGAETLLGISHWCELPPPPEGKA